MKQAMLILLAGSLLGACKRVPQEAVAAPIPDAAPSQIMRDFEMNDTRLSVKTMTLRASEARMYDDQKYANLDQPVVDFYKDGKPSSRLTAPSGKVQMETHAVEAWGGVKIVTIDSTTLTTERLRYDPDTRKILSDDPVHLEKPDSITDGIGLVTDPELSHTTIRKQKVQFKKGMKS